MVLLKPNFFQTLFHRVKVSPAAQRASRHPPSSQNKAGLAVIIGTLGVVYGDIGTSPLYAMSEAFFGHYPLARTAENVFGVVSLVFWSLVLVVTIKYVGLILRVDNNGEGGIFALLGLLLKAERSGGRVTTAPEPPAESRSVLGALFSLFRFRHSDAEVTAISAPRWLRSGFIASVIIGASLLYGDGVITPAISVLSAVEGLSIVTSAAKKYEIWATLFVLVGLFLIQKRGTHRIGWLFGPIMAVWFVAIGTLGLVHIVQTPNILYGLSPSYAVAMAYTHGWHVLLVLGAVVLCVTGVEAMYADLGHFGRKAISRSWMFLVFPCLLLNYFGQGAFMLTNRPVPENHLFYALTPKFLLLPMVILATMATVIASQALISGAYSLTQQAIALGLFPRIKIVHTNPDVPGQIYMPFINNVLLIGCCWLVVSFRHSADLAAAYGIAVTATMVVTTVAFTVVSITVFHWRKSILLPLLIPILFADLLFFGSNLLKFRSGGYVPVLIGLTVFIIMDTWRWGRRLIGRAYQERLKHYHLTVQDIIDNKPRFFDNLPSVSVVVMASKPILSTADYVPPVLAVHYANWRRLPKHIIFLSIIQTSRPFEKEDNRYSSTVFIRDDNGTVVSVQARFGYMEQPNIRNALLALKEKQLVKIPVDPKRWLILVGAERFITPGNTLMEKARIALFSRLNRLAKPAIDYFGLETDSAVVTETINV
jgi:KUP system potassium uptake protein